MISNVFGADPKLAAIIGLLVVLVYSILGGLWASVTTSALSTLLHTVPSAIILVAALHYAGGVNSVWHSVAAQGNDLLSVARPDAATGFGITLALGLLTATIAGQEFWQVAWALKKKDVSRSFFWAGAWFYPIPICLGLLGLIGLALHVNVNTQLGGDAAAVGTLPNLAPWVTNLAHHSLRHRDFVSVLFSNRQRLYGHQLGLCRRYHQAAVPEH